MHVSSFKVYNFVLIDNLPSFNSFDFAVTIISPASPLFALTITKANPLNAFLICEGNATKSAEFPLPVATISPGPSIKNSISSLVRGTIWPF